MRLSREEFVRSALGLGAVTALAGGAESAALAFTTGTLPKMKDLKSVDFLSGGGKVWCLSSRADAISLSTVFVSPEGKVLVIDGGFYPDGEFLGEFLRALGGRVDYWLITHAHEDHMGAIQSMFAAKSGNPGVEIGEFLMNTPSQTWLDEKEPESKAHVDNFFSFLETGSGKNLNRGDCSAGRTISLGSWSFEILNAPYLCDQNPINNNSVCLTVRAGGKKWLVTGDLGVEGGQNLVSSLDASRMKHDVVFMAHHGQSGTDRAFYEAVSPEVAIWPCPTWVWENATMSGALPGSHTLKTNYVKCWMQELGVKKNYVLTRDHVFV